MSAISNFLENELLDHTLGIASYTAPSTIYLALFTTDPTDADTGTEVSGFGYARQETTFGAAVSGASSNTTAETFSATGGNFGEITHIGLYDALTTGNLLYHTALSASRIVNNGESLSFAIGAIDVSLD